jgi:predicted nucleic acid-binding Zn ribbon protein
VDDRIAALRRAVEEARSMPMSSSVVVSRPELLSMLDELAEAVRAELAEATELVAARDQLLDDGRRRAEELVDEAQERRQALASETEVQREAREQAAAALAAARQEADALRKETDEYVDNKLAGFEVALERSLETVRRGRQRLAAEVLDPDGDRR